MHRQRIRTHPPIQERRVVPLAEVLQPDLDVLFLPCSLCPQPRVLGRFAACGRSTSPKAVLASSAARCALKNALLSSSRYLLRAAGGSGASRPVPLSRDPTRLLVYPT